MVDHPSEAAVGSRWPGRTSDGDADVACGCACGCRRPVDDSDDLRCFDCERGDHQRGWTADSPADGGYGPAAGSSGRT